MKILLGFASMLLLFSSPFAGQPSIAQQSTVSYVNRADPACSGASRCYTIIQAAIDAVQLHKIIRIQGHLLRRCSYESVLDSRSTS